MALNLAHRAALIIGGDAEAAAKAQGLLDAGARLTVVAPHVCPPLARLALAGRLSWYTRRFDLRDLQGAGLVVLAPRDPQLAADLWQRRRAAGFLLCALDQPDYCDVFNLATHRAGPVSVSVGSGGVAPMLAARLRSQLAAALDDDFADFAREIGSLRASLADLSSSERRDALDQALRGFAIDMGVRYPATSAGASTRTSGQRKGDSTE